MPTINIVMLNKLILPSVLMFLLLGSLAGVALGTGLIWSSKATFSVMRRLNRWQSTRRALKPAELPRDFDTVVNGNRRWFGAIFAAAGAYSSFVLLAGLDTVRIGSLFGLGTFGVIALEALRWLLVIGSALALAAGAMLLVFPHAWNALESVANRWVSTRTVAPHADTMHVPLDRLVEAYPRKAGCTILVLSALAAINFAILMVVQ